MKAVVLKSFRDKTNKKSPVVKGHTYEASEERVRELSAKGYVKVEGGEAGEESVLKSSIADVKSATEGLNKEEFENLLEEEKAGQNRKGLVEYFENMIEAAGEGE